MNEVFKRHVDPGHSWLEVSKQKLLDLGIADQISTYSYYDRKTKTAYLEEDCDLSVFIAAYIVHYGIEPAMIRVSHDLIGSPECFIRKLSSYTNKTQLQIDDYDAYRLARSKAMAIIMNYRQKAE